MTESSALIEAVRKNDLPAVLTHLRYGADVNTKDQSGFTMLMLAACWGRAEIARFLIDNGANVNITNNSGDTALINAAYNGQNEIARLLIDNGADVNIKNNSGTTALIKAASWGHEKTAQLLRETMREQARQSLVSGRRESLRKQLGSKPKIRPAP